MKKISIYQIAAKNLLRKRTRSALTLVGIGLSAWVLASLLGFNQGYDSALKKDIDNMGFQVLLTAKGCPYEAATLMLKGGTGLRYMNETVVADILSQSEVESVTPMLMTSRPYRLHRWLAWMTACRSKIISSEPSAPTASYSGPSTLSSPCAGARVSRPQAMTHL